MFDFLPEVCRDLNGKMIEIYWTMLLPFTIFVISLEFIKEGKEGPNVGKIIRRVCVSVLLMLALDETMNTISNISDDIAEKISGIYNFDDLCVHLKANFEQISVSWLKFKEATIYLLSFCSYVLAYIGVFMSNALIYFVWSVLYVCAPLMILMYVSEKTAYVTTNLYKGLINVAIWKIFYSILGVMLFKFSTVHQIGPDDSFLTAVIVNLCIASAMLFTPFAVKSLLGDGMASVGAALAMVPSVAAVSMMKQFAKKNGKKAVNWTKKKSGSAYRGIKERITNARNNQTREETENETGESTTGTVGRDQQENEDE